MKKNKKKKSEKSIICGKEKREKKSFKWLSSLLALFSPGIVIKKFNLNIHVEIFKKD